MYTYNNYHTCNSYLQLTDVKKCTCTLVSQSCIWTYSGPRSLEMLHFISVRKSCPLFLRFNSHIHVHVHTCTSPAYVCIQWQKCLYESNSQSIILGQFRHLFSPNSDCSFRAHSERQFNCHNGIWANVAKFLANWDLFTIRLFLQIWPGRLGFIAINTIF